MASAFNAADIAAKKQELGYPADTTNVAYIEANHKLEDVIGAFNAFTGKNFVISFEENGLLFMGLTPLNHALMLDLRTDFSLPCKLIVEEHFLYDSIFTRI